MRAQLLAGGTAQRVTLQGDGRFVVDAHFDQLVAQVLGERHGVAGAGLALDAVAHFIVGVPHAEAVLQFLLQLAQRVEPTGDRPEAAFTLEQSIFDEAKRPQLGNPTPPIIFTAFGRCKGNHKQNLFIARLRKALEIRIDLRKSLIESFTHRIQAREFIFTKNNLSFWVPSNQIERNTATVEIKESRLTDVDSPIRRAVKFGSRIRKSRQHIDICAEPPWLRIYIHLSNFSRESDPTEERGPDKKYWVCLQVMDEDVFEFAGTHT